MQPPAIPVSRKCHDAPSSAAGAGVSVIPFVVNPQVRGTDLSLVIEGDAGYSLHGAIRKSSVMAWVGGPKARPVLPVGWFSACGWG
ncbi:hypothetical protein BMG523Draft_03166 [Frankia sp. BMG5.23]|nr:hypothetical protein BMG523Draft_03166 [Frankia sp. BMG5.23]